MILRIICPWLGGPLDGAERLLYGRKLGEDLPNADIRPHGNGSGGPLSFKSRIDKPTDADQAPVRGIPFFIPRRRPKALERLLGPLRTLETFNCCSDGV